MTFRSQPCRRAVNKSRPVERLTRVLAFSLSGLFYAVMLGVVFQRLENQSEADASAMNAVTLSFYQMELQAAVEAPPPEPEPEPEVMPEPEPEEAEVVLEEVLEESEPEREPEPEPIQAEAQVTQEAAAPVSLVEPDVLLGWLLGQIEREKYYPAAAERIGMTGTFELLITMGADGTIVSAEVLPGKGAWILRKALEKMMAKITGRRFGRPLGSVQEFPVLFEFE